MIYTMPLVSSQAKLRATSYQIIALPGLPDYKIRLPEALPATRLRLPDYKI